ncbi:hypothetical protein OG609_39855 [Streptomyces sp. NBC_01224]|nr:hypothetical protein OG609_39855 [Streptomyces sp. NBC_01224]
MASSEVNFTSFSCSTGLFAASVPRCPKRTQSEKPVNASTLLVAAVTRLRSGASER